MPKKCLHNSCGNFQFGGGYCKYHQSKRTDKKPVAPRNQSAKQVERMSKYIPIKDDFLKKNPRCWVGRPGCLGVSTNVHHSKGRLGDLLFDTKYFIPCCSGLCHRWAEDNPEEAKKMGVSKSRLSVN